KANPSAQCRAAAAATGGLTSNDEVRMTNAKRMTNDEAQEGGYVIRHLVFGILSSVGLRHWSARRPQGAVLRPISLRATRADPRRSPPGSVLRASTGCDTCIRLASPSSPNPPNRGRVPRAFSGRPTLPAAAGPFRFRTVRTAFAEVIRDPPCSTPLLRW